MSRRTTKSTKWHVRPAKIQISLGIRPLSQSTAQSDQSLRCLHEEALGPWLPIIRTAKTLIRLGGCPGWSESLLGAQVVLLVLSCGGSIIISKYTRVTVLEFGVQYTVSFTNVVPGNMDGWVRVLRPFNSISVISRRWKGEHEMLCAMKRRLGSGRISPPAGFEPVTPWSEVRSANRSATRTLLIPGNKMCRHFSAPGQFGKDYPFLIMEIVYFHYSVRIAFENVG